MGSAASRGARLRPAGALQKRKMISHGCGKSRSTSLPLCLRPWRHRHLVYNFAGQLTKVLSGTTADPYRPPPACAPGGHACRAFQPACCCRGASRNREGALVAVGAEKVVVPASEQAAARAEIAKLQPVLGKKTLENEILKQAWLRPRRSWRGGPGRAGGCQATRSATCWWRPWSGASARCGPCPRSANWSSSPTTAAPTSRTRCAALPCRRGSSRSARRRAAHSATAWPRASSTPSSATP